MARSLVRCQRHAWPAYRGDRSALASLVTRKNHARSCRDPHTRRRNARSRSYGGRLGLDMRLDRSNPAWGARLMFFRCGDLVVEIAHSLRDGVSDAEDSFGGLSWRVPDIEAAHARLSSQGFALSPVRTGRRPGSQVCTIRDGTFGVPTILLGVEASHQKEG